MTYKFGDWLVEQDSGSLHKGQHQQHLEPKAIDVLICLLENRGRVVSHDELLQQVWKHQVVETSAVPRNIAQIRRALGDDSKHPKYIETIPKRGYRTLAPVQQISAANGNRPNVTLAVLPFDNLSPDPDLAYFADGVSEEILQAVSKYTNVDVIGRTSSFQFRDEKKAVGQVAKILGCSHVLDGAIQRRGIHIRITAQLIECATQTTVWAEQFDRDLEDVFALQDEIASAASRALAVAFRLDVDRIMPIDPIAFDLYLQAKAASTHWLGACDAALLEQAVARAPQFAKAWATLAITRAIEAHVEREPARSEPHRRQAMVAAHQALTLDSASAAAYTALSIVEPICGRFDERDALVANALSAEPADAASLFWACRWSWAVGRHQEGLDYITRACQVEPLWAQGLHQYATMLWMVGQVEEAHQLWDRLTENWPDRDYLFVVPMGLNAQLGNRQKVDEITARLAACQLDTERTRRMTSRAQRLLHWTSQDTKKLADELTKELARTGTIRLYLQWACHIGLTETVYKLLEQASFEHLFKPSGRLHELDFGLHALFFREGEAMYRDPRFVALCARLGLCDYWARTQRWPDCAETLASHYDFRSLANHYRHQHRKIAT